MFGSVLIYGADEHGTTAWSGTAPIAVASRNYRLHSMVIANKASADFFVQVFDSAATASATLDALTPEYDLPVPAGSFLPFGFAGGKQFWNGVMLRFLTVQNGTGASAIASGNAKVSWEGMTGPVTPG